MSFFVGERALETRAKHTISFFLGNNFRNDSGKNPYQPNFVALTCPPDCQWPTFKLWGFHISYQESCLNFYFMVLWLSKPLFNRPKDMSESFGCVSKSGIPKVHWNLFQFTGNHLKLTVTAHLFIYNVSQSKFQIAQPCRNSVHSIAG